MKSHSASLVSLFYSVNLCVETSSKCCWIMQHHSQNKSVVGLSCKAKRQRRHNYSSTGKTSQIWPDNFNWRSSYFHVGLAKSSVSVIIHPKLLSGVVDKKVKKKLKTKKRKWSKGTFFYSSEKSIERKFRQISQNQRNTHKSILIEYIYYLDESFRQAEPASRIRRLLVYYHIHIWAWNRTAVVVQHHLSRSQ